MRGGGGEGVEEAAGGHEVPAGGDGEVEEGGGPAAAFSGVEDLG